MTVYILGNGNMAGAMARGLQEQCEVVLVGRNAVKLEPFAEAGFAVETYGSAYSIEGKDIVLAFKPYALASISSLLHGTATNCLSVLARTGLDDLQLSVSAKNHAVAMPNIAAAFCASATPMMIRGEASRLREIAEYFGSVVQCADQGEFDAAGVLAGCAPAYLALIAEGLIAGGVRQGLKAEKSREVIAGMLAGFSRLMSVDHPALIRERVCSPAGSTIEGINALEKAGVRAAMMDAVAASCHKQRG